MEPLSITTGVVSLLSGIANTTVAIKKFINDYREAGQDLRLMSSELFAVQNILETVRDELDGPTYIVSPRVERSVVEAAKGCSSTITQIHQLLLKYITESKRQKIAWALYAQEDLGKLRRNLDSHKATLNLALTRLDNEIIRQTQITVNRIDNTTEVMLENTELLRIGQAQLGHGQSNILEAVQELGYRVSGLAVGSQNVVPIAATQNPFGSYLREGERPSNHQGRSDWISVSSAQQYQNPFVPMTAGTPTFNASTGTRNPVRSPPSIDRSSKPPLNSAESAALLRQSLTPTQRLELDNQWRSILTKLHSRKSGRMEIATPEEHPELWEPAYEESERVLRSGASPRFLFSIPQGAYEDLWGTPLHFAIRAGHEDLILLLLAYGAHPKDRCTSPVVGLGATCLHVAASPETRALDPDRIIDLLVAHGGDVNSKSSERKTPVLAAESTDVLRALVKHGADIDFRGPDGHTRLETEVHAPLGRNCIQVVTCLLELGASRGNTLRYMQEWRSWAGSDKDGKRSELGRTQDVIINLLLHYGAKKSRKT